MPEYIKCLETRPDEGNYAPNREILPAIFKPFQIINPCSRGEKKSKSEGEGKQGPDLLPRYRFTLESWNVEKEGKCARQDDDQGEDSEWDRFTRQLALV